MIEVDAEVGLLPSRKSTMQGLQGDGANQYLRDILLRNMQLEINIMHEGFIM